VEARTHVVTVTHPWAKACGSSKTFASPVTTATSCNVSLCSGAERNGGVDSELAMGAQPAGQELDAVAGDSDLNSLLESNALSCWTIQMNGPLVPPTAAALVEPRMRLKRFLLRYYPPGEDHCLLLAVAWGAVACVTVWAQG
jgi:hypothetical protein